MVKLINQDYAQIQELQSSKSPQKKKKKEKLNPSIAASQTRKEDGFHYSRLLM